MQYCSKSTVFLQVCALLAAFALMPASSAAKKDETRIAVVNVQRAILMTEKAKQKLEELQKQPDFKNNLESIDSMKIEYEAMVEKYKKDRAVMSEEKREEEERRILDKQQDMKYIASKLQQLEKDYIASVTQESGDSLQAVLQKIVEEEKIGLLLRRDAPAIMHADSSYDITELVVERLNAIR